VPNFRYHIVDVFTERAFAGNPLAVFPDANDIESSAMQSIAREFNLSETTFVLPPADKTNQFRVRIFTPAEELPFAGHPTLGTTFVLARLGRIKMKNGKGKAKLEEGVGVIPVDFELTDGAPGAVTMEQPRPTFGREVTERDEIAELLSLPASALHPNLPLQVISCGIPYLIVPLADLSAARRARPRADLWMERLRDADTRQILIFTLETERNGSTVHGRMFAPALGVVEDPATGSAAGPLGAYLVRHDLAASTRGEAKIVIEQGIEIGRPSFLRVGIHHEDREITRVRVGGSCVAVGEGTLAL